MLARTYLSAAKLGISDAEHSALVLTLSLMEQGKLVHVPMPPLLFQESPDPHPPFTGHFNMDQWSVVHGCGTVACIGGTAELVGGLVRSSFESTAYELTRRRNFGLNELFFPPGDLNWSSITPAQAAVALRSYLTTGTPRWESQ